MSEWNKSALVKLQGKLKEHILMTGLRDMLQKPAGGFMSAMEARSVTDLSGEMNQIGQIITILLGKGDREFSIFTEMLRCSNYEAWANELESTAESFKKCAGMECFLPVYSPSLNATQINVCSGSIVYSVCLHQVTTLVHTKSECRISSSGVGIFNEYACGACPMWAMCMSE